MRRTGLVGGRAILGFTPSTGSWTRTLLPDAEVHPASCPQVAKGVDPGPDQDPESSEKLAQVVDGEARDDGSTEGIHGGLLVMGTDRIERDEAARSDSGWLELTPRPPDPTVPLVRPRIAVGPGRSPMLQPCEPSPGLGDGPLTRYP